MDTHVGFQIIHNHLFSEGMRFKWLNTEAPKNQGAVSTFRDANIEIEIIEEPLNI